MDNISECMSCKQNTLRYSQLNGLDQWFCVMCHLHIKKPIRSNNAKAINKTYPKKIYRKGGVCFSIY